MNHAQRFERRIIDTGSSKAITIPYRLADRLELEKDELIEVKIRRKQE